MAASQFRTLQIYLALSALQPQWAGGLLLCFGLGDAGKAFALAGLAAGAAVLAIDDDEARLRAANREGCSNFTVTTMDEAVRILKNEVRKGSAVVVALKASPNGALAEIVERGLQPDYVATEGDRSPVQLQAPALSGLGFAPAAHSADLAVLLPANFSAKVDVAPTLAGRRSRDQLLIATTADAVTQRWLLAAPTLFPRDLVRNY